MKQIYLIVFLFFGILLVCLGQPSKQTETCNKINQLIRSGDANALSAHMKEMVELAINNSAETYSKTQVVSILKDFFKDNPPQEFEMTQTWKEDNIIHVLGTYSSQCKTQYRFYYALKKESSRSSNLVIYNINIEQTKKCKNKCTQNQNVSKN